MNIKLQNLTKKYTSTNIFSIEDFCFESSKIYAIMGENGAGKSTLMNILAGLDLNYFGSVSYDNKPLNEQIQKNISMIFQNPIPLKTTVFKNITYPLKIRKYSKDKIDDIVNETLSKVGIEHLANQNAQKLSGGEMQKMAFSRALCFKPKLLLLDEPFSGIDYQSIEKLEDILKNYNKEHKATVILITHSLESARRLTNNIITLSNGKLTY